jgi:hypothetical protein
LVHRAGLRVKEGTTGQPLPKRMLKRGGVSKDERRYAGSKSRRGSR